MRIQVIRDGFGDHSTEGKMYIDGHFKYYTIEDKDRKLENGSEKVFGETCIPRGVYKVALTMSTRFKKIMPQILEVPQFEGIRIHVANSSKDVEGCIGIGLSNDSTTDDYIGQSRLAYEDFMKLLEQAVKNGEDIEIEVS